MGAPIRPRPPIVRGSCSGSSDRVAQGEEAGDGWRRERSETQSPTRNDMGKASLSRVENPGIEKWEPVDCRVVNVTVEKGG